MVGLIIVALGIVGAWRLWVDHRALAILTTIATIYNALTFHTWLREPGYDPREAPSVTIAMVLTLFILIMFILSWFI